MVIHYYLHLIGIHWISFGYAGFNKNVTGCTMDEESKRIHRSLAKLYMFRSLSVRLLSQNDLNVNAEVTNFLHSLKVFLDEFVEGERILIAERLPYDYEVVNDIMANVKDEMTEKLPILGERQNDEQTIDSDNDSEESFAITVPKQKAIKTRKPTRHGAY